MLDLIGRDAPAGPDLEYDPEFAELERSAQRKPEQQVGSTIIPAAEPDWREVASRAQALLGRGLDLRVLRHLAVGRLHQEGMAAFVETLELITRLLAERWEDIHPLLDPEDDLDPTMRANVLKDLGQYRNVIEHLRGLALLSSPRLGRFSWRDMAMASGEIDTPADTKRPSEGELRGAARDTDPASLAALRQAARSGTEAAVALVAAFEAKAGPATGPDLDDLRDMFRKIARGLDHYAPADAAHDDEDATLEAPATDLSAQSGDATSGNMTNGIAKNGAAPRGGVTAASLTDITTRADALLLLDLVCRYYARYEPSSPLPLLIERARRLADKDFLDILRDLAPDGLGQAQIVAGRTDDPSAGNSY